MVAYLTWRGIPLPCRLLPVARRGKQPLFPPPQPGTYGNAAVTRMMAGAAQHHSSSTSSRRTAIITTQPRSRATAASGATNVRVLAPSGAGAPQSSTTSGSSRPSTSAPHATVHSPHRLQTTDATRLRAFRRHQGPARHRAPGNNVHPNGRRNDTSRSTTQPQRSRSIRHHLRCREIAAEENKNQEKDVQPDKIKREINFSDLRNPRKHFTPLFGEVAKFRTLTEREEQQSRDSDKVERCLPRNT